MSPWASLLTLWSAWNWLILPGLVGLVVALAGLIWYARRRPATAAPADEALAKAYDGYGGIADHPYGVPAIAMLGTVDADLTPILDSLEPASFGGEPAGDRRLEGARSCLTRDGIVHAIEPSLWQAGDWGKRWRRLIHTLAAERPLRPLDGIVVVLSAGELVDAHQQHSDRLTMLGEQIAETVAMLERHGAMRVPLYLVLSGGEQMPGFTAWRQCLQAHGSDRPFGWAVHGERTVFGRRFGDDAMTECLDEALTSLQLELMREQPAAAAGLVALSAAIDELAVPLGRLMNAGLRPSAYHKPVMWRGFWITGRGAADQHRPMVFARELFSRKIFREYRLAEPSRRMLGRRGQQIRWAQGGCAAAALLALLGVWYLVDEPARVASVERLMSQIDAQIRLAADAPAADRDAGAGAVRLAALNLLNAMTGVSVTSLSTPLAPTSLFSGADQRVERAIGRAYDRVVLRAIGGRLTNMTDELIATGGGAATSSEPGERLAWLVGRTETYVNMLTAFANLRRTGEIEHLAKVADYALGIQLPSEFTQSYHLYGEALSYTSTPELDLLAIRQSLQLILEAAFTGAAERFFGETELEAGLRDLVAALADARDYREQAGRQSAIVTLQATHTAIGRIEAALQDPVYAWLFDTEEPIGAPFADLVARLDSLPTFGPDRLVSATAQARLLASVEDIRRDGAQRIGSYRYSRGMLVTRADGRLVLSPSLLQARNDMAAVAADMGGTDTASLELPDGSRQRVLWQTAALERVLALVERYHRHQGEAEPLPSELQPIIERFAEARLAGSIRAAIDRVGTAAGPARFGASTGLGDGGDHEHLALAQSTPILIELLAALRRADMPALAEELAGAVAGQALRLLAQLDLEMLQAAPYQPDLVSIGLWRGQGSPAPALLGVRTEAQLAALLPARRQFVEKLALERARPLVQLVMGSGLTLDPAAGGLLHRWQQLITAIDLYQRGDPASPLMRLEQFLLSDLADMAASDCANLSDPFADLDDYLATSLVMLQETIAERCADIFGESAARRYEAVAADFMTALAGRFPFVGDWSDREALERSTPAASAAVRKFFMTHGEGLAALRNELLIAPVDHQAALQAVRFLDDLAVVRQALSPMLDPRPPARPLRYQLRVGFRTDRDFEQAGEQILGWRLTLGAASIEPQRNDHLLPWTAGQPVALELRWARNAPQRPTRQAASLDDSRLRWRAEGDWALFELIAQLLPERELAQNLAPGTLALRIPLEANPDAPQRPQDTAPKSQELAEALVFARLELGIEIADGEVVAVPLPSFPSYAPRLREVIPVSEEITGARGTLPLLLPIR